MLIYPFSYVSNLYLTTYFVLSPLLSMGENYDELRAQALNGDHNTNPLASPFYNPTSQQLVSADHVCI